MNATINATEYLTPYEAARQLNIRTGSLYPILYSDLLPGAHKVDGQWRIPREAVEAYPKLHPPRKPRP